ncbi:MAG: preprotein translocase subunit SecG [Gammaproteobacteria bacterium]|nr:preprotein translocase subunit SecG [Gammaproteobacteria bacterium]
MKDLVLVIDVISAVALIGLILLQQGKGADIGAAFGSGASQTLFGSRGSANFLTRATAILGTVFFLSNLGLAWLYAQQAAPTSVTQSVVTEQPAKTETPAPSIDVPAVPKTPEVPK